MCKRPCALHRYSTWHLILVGYDIRQILFRHGLAQYRCSNRPFLYQYCPNIFGAATMFRPYSSHSSTKVYHSRPGWN